MTFIALQAVIGLCSGLVAIFSLRSFKRTGDDALKNIAWAFFYFGIHSFTLVITVSLYLQDLIPEGLSLGLIFAKIPLFVGLLYLLRIPILYQNMFIKNYYSKIVIVVLFLIAITSFASFISPTEQFVNRGDTFVVEYIGHSLNAAGILLLPYFVVILFIYSLWSRLPRAASLFFRSKIVLLCLGMITMLVGYSAYILSTNISQSLLGVSLVFTGDILIVIATALSPVRQFILSKNTASNK